MNPPPLSFVRPEFQPLSMVRSLWKGKLLIAGVWTLAAGISAAVILWLPAAYYADALILVESPEIPEKYVASSVSLDFNDRLATLRQQILSGSNLQQIIDEFGLFDPKARPRDPEDLYEKLRNDISIRPERSWSGGRSSAFRIGFQGSDPTLAARVANRIATLFVDSNQKARELLALGTSEFLESQLEEAKRKLDGLEAVLSSYKIRHNGELPQQENSLLTTLQQLRTEAQGTDDSIARAQQNRILLENSLAAAEGLVNEIERNRTVQPIASRGQAPAASRPAPAAAVRQSQVLQAQIDQLRLRYSDKHPEIRRLSAELERVKLLEAGAPLPKLGAGESESPGPASESAAAIAPQGPPAGLIQARERAASLRTQIAAIDADLAKARERKSRLQKDIGGYQARIEMMPVREQEIARMMRDYDTSRTNYTSLLNKKLSAEMGTVLEQRQKSEKFTIIELARPPEKPSKPNRPTLLGIALLGSLAFAMALAMARELHRGVVLGEWELPSDIPVLARMPVIRMPGLAADAGMRRGGRAETVSKPMTPAHSTLVILLVALIAGAVLAAKRF